jgi:hypothetical protein
LPLKAFEGFTAGVIDALEQARTALGQEIGLSQFVHALPDVVAYRVRSGHVEIADQTVTSFEEQHPRMQRCPPFLARGDSPRTLAKGSCHLVKGPTATCKPALPRRTLQGSLPLANRPAA